MAITTEFHIVFEGTCEDSECGLRIIEMKFMNRKRILINVVIAIISGTISRIVVIYLEPSLPFLYEENQRVVSQFDRGDLGSSFPDDSGSHRFSEESFFPGCSGDLAR